MKLAITLIVLALLIIVGPAAWQFTHTNPAAVPTSGLPWQIDTPAPGESRVFSLTLGRSTLADARTRFGPDAQLAIVATPSEAGNVELYYESITAGFIGGRLIVTAELPAATVEGLRERAAKTEYMQSTTRKATLAEADLPVALAAPIRAIAFIPSANLDEAIVVERFGAPAERLRSNDHIEHLLYPSKGLDVVLDSKGKELLQYVAPVRFDALRTPLRAAADQAATAPPAAAPDKP